MQTKKLNAFKIEHKNLEIQISYFLKFLKTKHNT